jgi:hypothetical protein
MAMRLLVPFEKFRDDSVHRSLLVASLARPVGSGSNHPVLS